MSDNPSGPRVEVLGIRHHGPGSARSVGEALEELQPDRVLVEGAPELDAVVALIGDADMVPPVAGLVYAVDQPRLAMFYPLAEFSPEWVAVRWAIAHGVPVQFADLPATHQLAPAIPEDPDVAEEDPDTEAPQATPATPHRADPLAALAAAAGYDDPERWWEDAVEHRATSTLERFAAVREAMHEYRETEDRASDTPEVLENARREAAMRKAVRAALKEGSQRIAFVCGAYHAPALVHERFPPATHDNRLLAGLPKVKVTATWAPWTSGRLAMASGYGAGVTSPGWYQHLFTHWSHQSPPAEVGATWMVRVARALREEQLDASTASVVEATRLADALAAVRGRPSVGLSELDDAAQAVLCDGSSLPLRLVHDRLVVGHDLGSVPEATPTVPLAADLARQQRTLRLKPSPAQTQLTLDLRREGQRARSVLLHRLRLLDVPWGVEGEEARTMGTFRESWQLEWRPEFAVALIEASMFGTTIAAAAGAKVAEVAAGSDNLSVLSALANQCLVADLPQGLARVVEILEERTARQHDVLALLGTIEPLARTRRYGDVRDIDTRAVSDVLRGVVTRAAVGLGAACSGLDDDAADALRSGLDGADRGVALLDDDDLRKPWLDALVSLARQDHVPGVISGRVNRILLDNGQLDAEEATVRMSRRLSVAAPAQVAASWLDGFLSGDSVLLVHDPALLGVIDDWVVSIGEETFEDLLPLLRRTFSRFAPPERRAIGEQVVRLASGRPTAGRDPGATYDLERAQPAVATVARLLGLETT